MRMLELHPDQIVIAARATSPTTTAYAWGRKIQGIRRLWVSSQTDSSIPTMVVEFTGIPSAGPPVEAVEMSLDQVTIEIRQAQLPEGMIRQKVCIFVGETKLGALDSFELTVDDDGTHLRLQWFKNLSPEEAARLSPETVASHEAVLNALKPFPWVTVKSPFNKP